MQMHTKLLATIIVVCVLSTAASIASARRLQASNDSYLVSWSSLELVVRDAFGVTHTVRCPLTLEGSFHSRTLSKVSGQLVGYISHAIVGACTAGTATALTETLPWHIRYDRFIGSLPSITGIRTQLVDAGFLVNIGFECLYRSTAARPIAGILNRDTITGATQTLTADATTRIPLASGEFGCPTEGSFQGTAEVFIRTDWRTRITVRLVQ
jgi:hypothetical protein